MATFDILAALVVFICIIISMMRGVIAEIAALMTWIVSFIAARMFGQDFAEAFLTSIQPHALSVAVGFILVFAAAWLVMYLLRSLLTSMAGSLGLGSVNRLLGGVFGALKGVLIITFVVLVCSFTDLPKTNDWRSSVSAPYFETLASTALPALSDYMTEKLKNPMI
ncbi:CvpA family protein [Neisseria sp. 83E34]|uniref:CvpA family protein n=1 Tax=Neisseria sp. 83E34 TaxID=1692264 RepID=UPI0006CE7858|nr:CvpA family protein [Neisseria sp. 83E34]KPN70720.1 colicin V production protein [Neisseria sp. 83E34]